MTRDVTRHVTQPPADVCVVGGGLAGVCAALAAARQGAATVLVTDRPVLGGNSSSELRVPPAGSGYYNPWATETGLIHELILADRARNHDRVQYGHANGVWDFVLYDACRREPQLRLLLNTNVCQVEMGDERTIAAVIGVQSGTASTVQVPARWFIDASGDGAVGVGAGVPFRLGAEARAEYGESEAPEVPDDFQMGSTLTFRARDLGVDVPYTPPDWAAMYDFPNGVPHRSTSSFEGGYWWIEVGWPLDTVFDHDQIRDELLRHVYGIWDHIKNRGRERERARTWVLDWVGFIPARRESRRFVGSYVLTQQDLQARRPFADTVAYGGWSIDDHTRGGILALDKRPSFDSIPEICYFCRPYPVPLRSLGVDEVDNLLLAGRVMSASRIAFSSLRVQQTLATVGQAAGTAAAYGARTGLPPRAIAAAPEHLAHLQQRLLRDDAWLPGVSHDDLLRGGRATATSDAVLHTSPGAGELALASAPAALLPVTADRIEAVSLYLHNPGPSTPFELALHPAAEVWDLEALETPPLAVVTATAPTGEGWVDVTLGQPVTPERFYWLRAAGGGEVRWRYAADEPIGTVSAYRRPNGLTWFGAGTWSYWRSLAVNVAPESRPYGASLVVNGVARPHRWTNAWVSDPSCELPQALEVSPPQGAVTIDTVQVLFDTALNRINYVTPGLHHPPECVRDYRIEGHVDGGWRELVSVTGNEQRRREHRVAPVTVGALRVTVTATWGDASARIYAVRAYCDG